MTLDDALRVAADLVVASYVGWTVSVLLQALVDLWLIH